MPRNAAISASVFSGSTRTAASPPPRAGRNGSDVSTGPLPPWLPGRACRSPRRATERRRCAARAYHAASSSGVHVTENRDALARRAAFDARANLYPRRSRRTRQHQPPVRLQRLECLNQPRRRSCGFCTAPTCEHHLFARLAGAAGIGQRAIRDAPPHPRRRHAQQRNHLRLVNSETAIDGRRAAPRRAPGR